MSNVVVKQGTPSKSGEVVDTSTAPVVDAHAANKAALDAALLAQDEGKSVERRQDIAAKATAMTGTTTVTDRLKEQSKQRSRKTPERAAKEAARKTPKPVAATKPAAKRGAGNGSGPAARLTDKWPSKKGRDVQIKDRVKLADGIVTEVIGRWTKKTKEGKLVPMVTGHIVSLPTGASRDTVKGKEKKVGDRCNAVAADTTHVKA